MHPAQSNTLSQSTELQQTVETQSITSDDANTSETDNTVSTLPTRAHTPFRGKSTFIPPKFRNSSLDTYCRLVEKDVSMLTNRRKRYQVSDNLSQEQHDEFKKLKEDKTVVIQSADKGGTIVILDRVTYDQEPLRQLANTRFYKKLESNPIADTEKRIHNVLNGLLES